MSKHSTPQTVDKASLVSEYKAGLQNYVTEHPTDSFESLKAYHLHLADNLVRRVTSNCAKMTELQQLLESNFQSVSNEHFMNLNWHKEEDVAIGIDLGTVNSVTAVYLKVKPQIINSPRGNTYTPSCVAFFKDKEGKVKEVFGKPVQNLQCKDPQNTIHDVKRFIGRNLAEEDLHKAMKNMQFSVTDDKDGLDPLIHAMGGPYSPQEISAKLLAEFKRVAEDHLKVPVNKTVITVPAYFNNDQRKATQLAGELAGFQVLSLLNEPTAAAIAYKLERLNENARKVIIFDLGGGTFDVAVLAVGNTIEVMSIGGDPLLGGIDFDNKLMSYCIEKYKKEHNCADIESMLSTKDEQSRRKRANFLQACEKVKQQLSFTETESLFICGLVNGEDFEVEVTRSELESLIEEDLKKTIKIMDQTLRDAKVESRTVDDIVLVGGATRIPKLREMLTEFFPGRKLNVSINPDEAVAYGAAMQAALLNGMKIAEGFVNFKGIQDITPMSFGVDTVMNGRRGVFEKVIGKNSKIPAEGQEMFVTSHDGQTTVRVRIFQGDSDQVADNFFLGEFLLSGIPPGSAGSQQVDVIMKITPMGIMHVEAVCKATGSSSSKTLTITRIKNTYEEGKDIEII